MAFVVQSYFLASRAVREGNMVVRDIVEKVDFLLLQEQTSSNRMDRCITPTLVEESSILVKTLEEVEIRF